MLFTNLLLDKFISTELFTADSINQAGARGTVTDSAIAYQPRRHDEMVRESQNRTGVDIEHWKFIQVAHAKLLVL